MSTLIISHDPNGKWYYQDEEGVSKYFDNIDLLFKELKHLGKITDGDNCPTCFGE